MSKFKLFGSAVGFAMIAYGAYTYQAYDPMKVCIALSLICLIYGLYKVIRDIRLATQTEQPQTQTEQVTRTSSNNRLFVPPPLDK